MPDQPNFSNTVDAEQVSCIAPGSPKSMFSDYQSGNILIPTHSMKTDKTKEIKGLVESFCEQYLNEELATCSLRLCDTLGRSRKLDVTRGKKEIWASSIVYVIARVNFLFDKANRYFLNSDTICDFFGTKKTTVGNKATSIEKALNIGIGDAKYCTSEIRASFSMVELPGGLIIPVNMIAEISREIVIEIAGEEETRKIEKFMAQQKKQEEEAERARIKRRAEINRSIAEQKQKKKEEKQAKINKRQLKLW